ncbi:unnamed protein product [Pedinophyceae sp. YPF-701]|nr:unnamed protein product [Pedinophyceae sp. YPF-701]
MSLVNLSPEEVRLPKPNEGRKYSSTFLTLNNPTSKFVAFKIKTTSPKRYCVKPSSGLLKPQQTQEVQISLLGKEAGSLQIGLTTDKFLVQSVSCTEDTDPKTDGTIFKQPGVSETKLKVFLDASKPPVSPIIEPAHEDSPSGATGQETMVTPAGAPPSKGFPPSSDSGAIAELKQMMEMMQKTQLEMKAKVNKQAAELADLKAGRQMFGADSGTASKSSGPSFLLVLILVLLVSLVVKMVPEEAIEDAVTPAVAHAKTLIATARTKAGI